MRALSGERVRPCIGRVLMVDWSSRAASILRCISYTAVCQSAVEFYVRSSATVACTARTGLIVNTMCGAVQTLNAVTSHRCCRLRLLESKLLI